MKTKNKISALLLIVMAIMTPTIQSCKKYSEGPAISLRSRTSRITNTWLIANYKVNNNDYTPSVNGYSETYLPNGTYSFHWGNTEGSGRWAFQNNDREIRITGVSQKDSETLYILKLEKNEFWYYYLDGNDKYELHLISN